MGWFRLTENQIDLPYEIGLNEHWVDRPDWELCETITHELGHLYDQEVLGYKAKTNYHRREFVEVMNEIGLYPKLGKGYHLQPDDGQFARLMDRMNIPRPSSANSLPTGENGGILLPPGTRNWFDFDRGKSTGGKVKGNSTLRKWVCSCDPPQAARIGTKVFIASCGVCREPFRPEP